MDADTMQMVQNWIEEELKPIREELETLKTRVDDAWDEIEKKVSENHYHEDHATAEHVERSENSFNSQITRLRDDLHNLEYRVSDAERKAESAQRAADSTSRNSRGGGGYW